MSEMSRGRVRPQTANPSPPVPVPSPPICEGRPHPSPSRPQSPYPSPFPALYSGDGGRVEPGQAPTGTSRTPRIRVHPICHAPILAGLDANRCALSVAVDPYPLTPAGEVWALRAGRRTYALQWGALERRDAWTIPGHPPSPGLPVMAEHVCGHPIPDEHRAPPTPHSPAPADKEPF